MNILYIAYSCNPFAGSEDKIGWCVPYESSKTNKVYVITKEEQREPVEKYLQSHPLENIKFYYVDIPNFYKKIFKGFMYSGRLNVWNRRVLPLAKKICADQKIDVIHQITPIEFRAIGDYGKIANIKFVCGPLGGGESLPNGLKDYAKGHEIIEVVRSGINRWYRFKLRITGKLNRCDYIMFANKETQEFLVEGAELNCPYELVFDNGLRPDELVSWTEKEKVNEELQCKANEDKFFLFETLLRTSKVVILNSKYYCYWTRQNSATTRPFDERWFDCVYFAQKIYTIISTENPELEPQARYQLLSVSYFLLRQMDKVGVQNDFENEYFDLIKTVKNIRICDIWKYIAPRRIPGVAMIKIFPQLYCFINR